MMAGRDGRMLLFRSVFEFFPPDDRQANPTPPLDGKGFLQDDAGAVVDDGIEFSVYDAGSESRRYQVLWGIQDFRGADCPRICDKLHYSRMFDSLNYYLIMRKDESVKPIGNNSCFVPLGLADWTIREANWEQRYAAKDWWPEYMRLRATRVDWSPFGY